MAVQYSPVAMATEMMKSALVLLDGAGESDAALKLQEALDVVRRDPVAKTVEQANELLDLPEARAMLARLGRGRYV